MHRSDAFIPNAAMAAAAQRGVDLRSEFGRGGTSVGAGTARTLINQTAVGLDKVKQIYSYFRRHSVDEAPGWDDPQDPSNGYIAWLLWGGDAGRAWSTGIRDRAIAAKVWHNNGPKIT